MDAPERSTAPERITRRGPNRSTRIPAIGARRPWRIVDIDWAPAVSPRDQWNSSMSGTRNTENEK